VIIPFRLLRRPALIAAVLLAVSMGVAGAQNLQRIAAVVNDDVISVFDLDNRTALVLATSGLSDSSENRRRVQAQILRSLIDERLQLQEADRLNAQVADREMTEAVQRIEQANRMQPGQLRSELLAAGVDPSTIMNQIKASIAWQKVVQRRLRPSLQVGQDEIDEVLERINASKGTVEYLLAEIFLSVENPDQEEEVRANMENMLQQMGRGVAFAAMAQQFSQSASSASGGDIGWVEQGQLEEEVARVLDQMPSGRATMPIRTPSGFYVYLLREKRVLAAPAPEDATVTLAQVMLPLEPNASPDEIRTQRDLAETVQESVKGCEDLKRVSSELGLAGGDPSPPVKIADLNPALRPLVADLKVGAPSPPVETPGQGVAIMMVCERQEPPSNLPSRDDIMENLTRQRLDLIARRYLRDLRRTAFIDVRV
jgi:peptidyl-prolyl cis-trans isomerase SurA